MLHLQSALKDCAALYFILLVFLNECLQLIILNFMLIRTSHWLCQNAFLQLNLLRWFEFLNAFYLICPVLESRAKSFIVLNIWIGLTGTHLWGVLDLFRSYTFNLITSLKISRKVRIAFWIDLATHVHRSGSYSWRIKVNCRLWVGDPIDHYWVGSK